jgi:aqualysin 1
MKRYVVVALAGAMLVACSDAPSTQDKALASSTSAVTVTSNPSIRVYPAKEPIQDQYIVVLKEGGEKVGSIASAQVNAAGAQLMRTYEHALRGYSVRANADGLQKLMADPRVKYIQQDGVIHVETTQADPPWGLDRIDHRAGVQDQLYTYNATGAGVNVYVIDTGVRITHQDFGGRAQHGFDSVGDGQNGNDCHGHGTHVAGTAGGATYGVAKEVSLFAVRVLSCEGSGSLSGVIAGVDWVTANRVLPAVANMSLGGSGAQALDDAVTASVNSGVVYAVAGGNSSTDACFFSPARAPAAITVGASDSDDSRAYFSNYGTCLDIFAPGVGVLSAWNTNDTATNTISGTSMASPHVAGTAALYLSLHPQATPDEVATALTDHAAIDQLSNEGPGSPNLLLYERFIGDTGGGDTTPPTVSLLAPSDGDTVSGDFVELRATASDDVGVQGLKFYVDGTSVGSGTDDGTGTYTVTWSSILAGNGSHTVKARAFDAEGNAGSSATVTIIVANAGGATWSSTYMVPMCEQSDSCDTTGLVVGRGPLGPAGAEPNNPNTVLGQCVDGYVGQYHVDESVERVRIHTLDGSPMAPGKQVQVDVTVWAYGDGQADSLDLFLAPNGPAQDWTLLTTLVPPGGDQQTLSYQFTLPESASNIVGVRAAFRFSGVPAVCDDGYFSDRDDLLFLVGAPKYPPAGGFSYECAGLSCSFTDTSADPDGNIVSWGWSFGDGTFSYEQNPSHHFAYPGVYIVSLVVQDDQGMVGTAAQMLYVTGLPPVASFEADCGIMSCTFTDTSTDPDGDLYFWGWTFGDGYYSTVQNPIHTFAVAGTYYVNMFVYDSQGYSSSITKAVTVEPVPNITLSGTASKPKGTRTVDLAWSGATSATVELYRNGLLLANTPNDGAERTTVDKNGTYTYRVCQAGTPYCSNAVTVTF